MSDVSTETAHQPDSGGENARAEWLDALQSADEDGELLALGDRHWAYMIDGSSKLLVTFDSAAAAMSRKGGMPQLHEFASVMGWSYLCILSDGDTWYRDPAVYGFFDGKVLEGFFDDFDHVLFYGAGMAGHAAAAFSVTAPGASVLAVAPRATMAPSRAPFETRDMNARRLDFSTRYGFAPDMIRGANDVWIIRDPLHLADAAQAGLFHGRHVHVLNLRLTADRAETALIATDILPRILSAVMKGEMSEVVFADLWRARRNYGDYLKSLLARCETARRESLSYAVCANVARRTGAPRFVRRLQELDAARTAGAHIPA